MNLHSSSPYWLLRHGIINSYPSLTREIKTEIAIMGAGISGALVANYLCQAGYKVTVVDRRHVRLGRWSAFYRFDPAKAENFLHWGMEAMALPSVSWLLLLSMTW
jgi:heterodisulfide reductase subunit A-like polyferredoxin